MTKEQLIKKFNKITPWHESLASLDNPTDFAERCAAIGEAAELRRLIEEFIDDSGKETPIEISTALKRQSMEEIVKNFEKKFK